MDIEGLGEKLVDQLVDGGIVHTPADVYKLDARQDLAALERMADKSRGERRRGDRQEQADDARAVHLRARASATSAKRRRATSPRHFGSARRADGADGRTALLEVNDVGPVLARERSRASSPSRTIAR